MTDTVERSGLQEEGKTLGPVHRLSTMTPQDGDRGVTWDPEVESEVNFAREAYKEAMAEGGYAAFRVDEGRREQIHSFRPEYGEIVLVRQMQGG